MKPERCRTPGRWAALAQMSIVITPRDRKILSWIVLVVGALVTAAGLFGVWLQGPFYEGGFPAVATVEEVRGAFTWPTAFTTAGSLMVAAAILASPLTASWPTSRRLAAFIFFALLVLVACTICGHIAGSRVARILH